MTELKTYPPAHDSPILDLDLRRAPLKSNGRKQAVRNVLVEVSASFKSAHVVIVYLWSRTCSFQ